LPTHSFYITFVKIKVPKEAFFTEILKEPFLLLKELSEVPLMFKKIFME